MKKLVTIFITAVFSFVVVLGALKVKRWFEIDACLDSGGSWNYEKNCCEYFQPAFADIGGDQDRLACAIGKVILAADKRDTSYLGSGGRGSIALSKTISEEYQLISSLNESLRVEFFWAILFHVDMDAGWGLEFIELIAKDCNVPFRVELEAFLKKSAALGLEGRQQKLAKSYLTDLKTLGTSP